MSTATFQDGTVNGVAAATIIIDLDKNGVEDARITLNSVTAADVRENFEEVLSNNSTSNLYYFGV